MKKLIQKISSVTLLLVSVVTLNAQNVGINATGAAPSGDAMLDIAAINKGLLVPRVNIANLTTIAPITGGATTSLLVYNTNATTGLGYYYWDGVASLWVKFTTGGDDWKIVGNANATSGTHFLGTTNGQALDFRTNNTIRFRVANANQVHAVLDGTNALPFYSFTNNTNMGMYRAAANTLGFATSAVERFRMSATEAVFNDVSANYDFRVESNGQANIFFVDAANDRVGIRNAAPANMFHMTNGGVNVGAASMALYENAGTNGVSLSGFNTSTANTYNGIEGATYGTYSSVAGIAITTGAGGDGVYGTTNDWQSIGVVGSRFNSGGANSGFGGLFYNDLGYTGGAYNVSDRRLKKDINPLNNALSLINQLEPVTYNYDIEKYPYIGLSSHKEYGFIAQEVKKVIPEIVEEKLLNTNATKKAELGKAQESQDEAFLMMDYSRLIPVAIQGIKEQQLVIEGQNKRIDELERIIKELQNKIEK